MRAEIVDGRDSRGHGAVMERATGSAERSRLNALILCIILGVLAGIGYSESALADGVDPRPVADFAFTDRTGKKVTKEDLLGKPWLVGFIFTRCAGPCPRVTGQMKLLQERTGIQLVSITVDPDYDTTEVLTKYADAYAGLKPGEADRWYFLTGDKVQIYTLIHRSFQMPVQELEGEDRKEGFEVIHSTNILLVDAKGRFIAKYNATNDGEMATLRRVIDGKEQPRIAPPPENAIPDSELLKLQPKLEAIQQQPIVVERVVPEWVFKLPAINASLNALATVLLLLGYVLIKLRKFQAHKSVMLSAFVVSILFLGSYGLYHSFELTKEFPGPANMKVIYLLILVPHVVLAVTVPFLASITIYRGLKGDWVGHKAIARITFPIWVYVSITGVIIYWMLYQVTWTA